MCACYFLSVLLVEQLIAMLWWMQECDARMQERAEELMEQVRSMFKDITNILQTMDLVDSIQLIGLDYHFEKEINEALNHIHDAHIDDHGLCDTALRFRRLRQQGYILCLPW